MKTRIEKTITAGPFPIYFHNTNTEMKLKGHGHYAEVSLTFLTLGSKGFPSFEGTHKVIEERLKQITGKPFKDSTNEKVADTLFELFCNNDLNNEPEIKKWDCEFTIIGLELAVRGVPDEIGHANGLTRYRINTSFQ